MKQNKKIYLRISRCLLTASDDELVWKFSLCALENNCKVLISPCVGIFAGVYWNFWWRFCFVCTWMAQSWCSAYWRMLQNYSCNHRSHFQGFAWRLCFGLQVGFCFIEATVSTISAEKTGFEFICGRWIWILVEHRAVWKLQSNAGVNK